MQLSARSYLHIPIAFVLLSTASFSLFASKLDVISNNGFLLFQSKDKRYLYQLNGHVRLDTGTVDSEENKPVPNTEINRAQLTLKTKFDKKWANEFEIEFAKDKPKIKDMWVGYSAISNTFFKVGNHKPYFSFVETQSFFMEPAIPSISVVPGRRIGFSGAHWHERFFVGVSLFGDGVAKDNRDPNGDGSAATHEPYSYSLRSNYRPFIDIESRRVFHVGVSLMQLQPQSTDSSEIRITSGFATKVFDYEYLDTGTLSNMDYQQSHIIEFAGQYGGLLLQAELVNSQLIRDKNSNEKDVEVGGYYVALAYPLTGSGRKYSIKEGDFTDVIPENENGDWELAVRYSYLDLNDEDANVLGGESNSLTLSVNWFVHSHVNFHLNQTWANLDHHADGDSVYEGSDTLSISSFRVEYKF